MKSEKEKNTIAQLTEMAGRVDEARKWKNLSEYLLFLRHKKAYVFAEPYCENQVVLDYGCGHGYGSFLLAQKAAKVFAVDINREVIGECIQRYHADNLFFGTFEPEMPLHFEAGTFGVAISFQVIEHVLDVRGYLNELKRLLKQNGILILTTPNRKHRLFPFQKPTNPYHLREYSLRQLAKDLNAVFDSVIIYGVTGTDEINSVEFARINRSPFKAYVKMPIKRFLGPRRSESLSSKMIHINNTRKAFGLEKESFGQYSVCDFSILKGNVEKGLDFLAILRKQ
ncbi:methyltransferase domain protein [delta proteobacterium NaphS2]|nr:methyltransferase domain protein [delta proteobacterium NaphS2]